MSQIDTAIVSEYKRIIADQNTDIYSWWHEKSSDLPVLYQLHKKYHCCPAGSVPSEKSFSIAGHVISKERNRLDTSSAERLIKLHINIFQLNLYACDCFQCKSKSD